MNDQTPLNPEALEAAARAEYPHLYDGKFEKGLSRLPIFTPDQARESTETKREEKKSEIARHASAYLAALPATQPGTVTGEQVNRAGWTCDGIHEPGSYATCDDCREACNDLANFYNGMLRNPTPGKPWAYQPEES